MGNLKDIYFRDLNKIYRASQLILDTYGVQMQGASEQVQIWLIHKVKHTFQVSHEIMNILYHEKKIYDSFSNEDKELTELCAILHDLGRFYQHQKGQKILPSSVFEHGAAAVSLLKDNPDFNNPILLFAVAEHNKYQIDYQNPLYTKLNDQDKKKAEIMAKLLRDADKLDNIRHTIYTGYHYLDNNYPKGPLSEGIKADLKEHKPCKINDIFTASDRLATYLAWVNDIYFDYTKSVICDLGFVAFCMHEMQNFGATDDDVAFLNK